MRRDVGRLLPISSRPLRVYAVPLPQTLPTRASVLAVTVRRDHRDEALRELLVQLAVAGTGALLVTSVVGYLLARLAFRPVEGYRRQSANIVAAPPGSGSTCRPGVTTRSPAWATR